MQCLGRIVSDKRGEGLLPFEGTGNLFHIPFRCDKVAVGGHDLCGRCLEREAATRKAIAEKLSGTSLPGNKPSYLHGRVTEPIPFWSHIYGGEWVRLKLEAGWKLSEETMARAKKAVEKAQEGVGPATAEPMPTAAGGAKRRGGGGRKPKAVTVAAAPAAETVVPAIETPQPAVAAPPPKKAPKRAAAPKKSSAAPALSSPAPAPQAILLPAATATPIENVRHITVKRVEVDGRDVYLEPKKQKVYDLKFRYIGRLRDDKIITFPDSDTE